MLGVTKNSVCCIDFEGKRRSLRFEHISGDNAGWFYLDNDPRSVGWVISTHAYFYRDVSDRIDLARTSLLALRAFLEESQRRVNVRS